MSNNNYLLLVIGIVIGLVLGIIITTYIVNTNQQTLELKINPTNAKALNQTEVTSIVSSTSEQGTKSILNLANGLTMIYNGTDIKSGDIIALNIMVYQPICSLQMMNGNVTNNTSLLLHIYKDPRCQDGFKAVQILDWHKLNQK